MPRETGNKWNISMAPKQMFQSAVLSIRNKINEMGLKLNI